MNPKNILILPGWQGSSPEHWQSRWERAHGYVRVEQHDWHRPLRGDWIARLEEVLLPCTEPVVLVAHSLGCLCVAAWAAHSQNTHRVKAALLVAPPDLARSDIDPALHSWVSVPMGRLPFKTVMFASNNDPFCSVERARTLASAWGAEFNLIEAGGHLNADSGLGDWSLGHDKLQNLAGSV